MLILSPLSGILLAGHRRLCLWRTPGCYGRTGRRQGKINDARNSVELTWIDPLWTFAHLSPSLSLSIIVIKGSWEAIFRVTDDWNSNKNTLYHTTLHHTTLHRKTLHHIALHHTTLHHITLHHIALPHITLRHIRLNHTTLHHTTLHHITQQ